MVAKLPMRKNMKVNMKKGFRPGVDIQYALSFDGIDDYVIAENVNLGNVTNSCTLSHWIYFEHWNYDSFPVTAANAGTHAAEYVGFKNNDDSFRFAVYDGSFNRADQNVSSKYFNQWNHLVGVFDDGTIYLFVNNELVATDSASKAEAQDNFILGYNPNDDTNNFEGLIDDVRFYDRALSENEINSLFNRKNITSGLTAYYPINKGEGSILYDKSQNSNDGDIIGATWVEV